MGVVDLRAKKSTVTILERLQSCYPVATSDDQRRVQYTLGEFNQNLCNRAVAALQDADAEAIGRLMSEAQAQFDSAGVAVCPEELTAPVFHRVLGDPRIAPHIWGGKGV